MKQTGNIRKMDQLGRLVIPKAYRNLHNWETDQPFDIKMEGDTLIIRPFLGETKEPMEELKELVNGLTDEERRRLYLSLTNEGTKLL